MKNHMIILTLLALFSAPSVVAIEVNNACREVSGGKTLLLLDLTCKTDMDCWPDADDVKLVDAATGKDTNYAINDMVWLNENGNVLDDMPESYPLRAIWDMSAEIVLPKTLRLEYDGEPLTQTIVPADACKNIPEKARELLNIGNVTVNSSSQRFSVR